MTIEIATPHQGGLEPLSALTMLTFGGLFGGALTFGALALTTRAFNIPLMVQAAITMAAKALLKATTVAC